MPGGPDSFSPEPMATKPDYPGAEEAEEADRERGSLDDQEIRDTFEELGISPSSQSDQTVARYKEWRDAQGGRESSVEHYLERIGRLESSDADSDG